MTNTKVLQGKMVEKKYSISKLAAVVGLSPTGLFNKIHNIREFYVNEMVCISECLDLSNEEREKIFFAKQVELNSTEQQFNENS